MSATDAPRLPPTFNRFDALRSNNVSDGRRVEPNGSKAKVVRVIVLVVPP